MEAIQIPCAHPYLEDRLYGSEAHRHFQLVAPRVQIAAAENWRSTSQEEGTRKLHLQRDQTRVSDEQPGALQFFLSGSCSPCHFVWPISST
jgi:hypothetical protein